MKFRLIIALVIVLMPVYTATPGHAARSLGPPIAEFVNERNCTAEVVVVRKLPGNKIAVRVNEYLNESDDAELALAVDGDIYKYVEIDESYLVVFSRLRKHAFYRDGWEENPKGPSLVKVRGLDEPAIYQASPALRVLLTPPQARAQPLTPDMETDLLLTVAETESDSLARSLAIFEMTLRGDLQQAISIDNAERFATLSMGADIKSRTFLLRAAAQFPPERRNGWLEREWRRAAIEADTTLDLSSFEPLLVKISLEGLRDHGDAEDIELISKHLYGNNPGVAKAALEALHAIDPKQALSRVQALLSKNLDLHMTTRQAFNRYVNEHSGA